MEGGTLVIWVDVVVTANGAGIYTSISPTVISHGPVRYGVEMQSG
jgi:hypothetical protein